MLLVSIVAERVAELKILQCAGSFHEKTSHLYTQPLRMGPYPHVLITIDVYKRIQNMSAISQAVLEKSYQQVTNLGSPRKAWT